MTKRETHLVLGLNHLLDKVSMLGGQDDKVTAFVDFAEI